MRSGLILALFFALLVFVAGQIALAWFLGKWQDEFERRHPNWREHEDFLP